MLVRLLFQLLIASSFGAALAAPQYAYTQSAPARDIVFDLDDTLIRWVRPDEIASGTVLPRSGGEIAGYRYRVLDGAGEMLQSVSEIPGVRVSFFSMGPRARNQRVLEELLLPDGRSARDIAYRVLSQEDATTLNGKELKDLTKVNGDLSNIILVDDNAHVLPGQERNVLRISPKPAHHYNSLGEKPAPGAEWKSASMEQFVQDRNKLAWARGALEQVLHPAETGNATLQQSLGAFESKGAQAGSRHADVRLYRRGAAIFHRVNPNYRFTAGAGTVGGLHCLRQILLELR